MDKQKLLELAGQLVLAGVTKNDDEIDKISAELAAKLRQAEPTQENGGGAYAPPPLEKDICGYLKFNSKEISKMPKSFRHSFRAEGQTICYRKRKRGKRSCSYEARYRRQGYNISVSSTSLDGLKKRFIEALHKQEKRSGFPAVPTTFREFAMYYFENFRKRKVRPETYKKNVNQLNNHLVPVFDSMPVKLITPLQCQELIDGFFQRGYGRTGEELHTLLNCTFKMAIAHGIIERNPLAVIFSEKHIRVHGKVLTIEEERLLLEKTARTRYQLLFAVVLYTGLRPCEYRTARIEGKFIVAQNRKRKTRIVEYKKIPVTPMLRPYLVDVDTLQFPRIEHIRQKFKSILPNHSLKDLRKTFNTHCEELKIATIARKFFMGHSLNDLDEAYTEPSDDFLLSEGEKFRY